MPLPYCHACFCSISRVILIMCSRSASFFFVRACARAQLTELYFVRTLAFRCWSALAHHVIKHQLRLVELAGKRRQVLLGFVDVSSNLEAFFVISTAVFMFRSRLSRRQSANSSGQNYTRPLIGPQTIFHARNIVFEDVRIFFIYRLHSRNRNQIAPMTTSVNTPKQANTL